MKLFCEHLTGNLFDVTHTINRTCPEIIPGIVHMESSGWNSIVVYRAEQEHPAFIRRPAPAGEG